MSVSYTTYLLYGFKLSPELFDWDNSVHEACACGAPNAPFDLVYDQMQLKYLFVGKVIAESDYCYNDDVLIDVTEKVNKVQEDFDSVKEKIADQFDITGKNPQVYFFVHAA